MCSIRMQRISICFSIFLFIHLEAKSFETGKQNSEHLNGRELLDYINSNQNLWKAERNEYFDSMSVEMKRKFFGTMRTPDSEKAKRLKRLVDNNDPIPESFHSREKWPFCSSIQDIRDQSSCGSYWAFGAVEAMSDRICIASNGTVQVMLSATDVVSCCSFCGFGCEGGFADQAWDYWVTEGIVSGSDYVQNEGCMPYPFPPCAHHIEKSHTLPCPKELYPTPICKKVCNDGYRKTYKQDKFYGEDYYFLENEADIQRELMLKGPLEVCFDVFEDFLQYKSGIYKHMAGTYRGYHAAKMIGWGVENSTKYWIIANSWNSDWGENGFFRIIRGKDECGIESSAIAGTPK